MALVRSLREESENPDATKYSLQDQRPPIITLIKLSHFEAP